MKFVCWNENLHSKNDLQCMTMLSMPVGQYDCVHDRMCHMRWPGPTATNGAAQNARSVCVETTHTKIMDF